MDESRKAAEFTELLSFSRSRIFGYIYALVQNQADTEELFQETTIRLWEKFEIFDPHQDFGTWAIGFAHLTVSNFIRVNRRKRLYFSDALLEDMAEVQQQSATSLLAARTKALTGCIDRLPPKDKYLVESSYSRGQPMKEVAVEVGRSSQAVYQAMSRIRQSLLRCIERVLAGENANG